MVWRPRATVAAVIERDARFLMVEERDAGARVLNQPAGHLEPGEGLTDAVVREVREETGQAFTPEALIGVYLWTSPAGITFLRFAFCGPVRPISPAPPLDPEILANHWLTPAELTGGGPGLRSPLVLRCIEDYRRGRRYGLEVLNHLDGEGAIGP